MPKYEIKQDIRLNWHGQDHTDFVAGQLIGYDPQTGVLTNERDEHVMRVMRGVIDMIATRLDDKLGRLCIVEGVRNVGKTHLLASLAYTHWKAYKYPFASYFKANIERSSFQEDTRSASAFHFSTGFDVTLLSMHKESLLQGPVVADRGFLSNIVLGVQQGRVTDEDATTYLRYLAAEGYLANVSVLYITADEKADERGKDDWEYLQAGAMHGLYMKYMKAAKELEPALKIVRFHNTFDYVAVDKFKRLFGLN